MSITDIAEFWEKQSCGEVYAVGESSLERLRQQADLRYVLVPEIHPFAGFEEAKDKDVLEIGVGMGADHLEWAKAGPRSLTGVDLTHRAIEFTAERFSLEGYRSDLQTTNAEQLPFAPDSFDIVYSWGVLHHSAHPEVAIKEAYRVLRPGGTCKVMIYHKYSIITLMLWLRYGLIPLKSFEEVIGDHMESPGTHAYSLSEARVLFADFDAVTLRCFAGHGDLLDGEVGQQHSKMLLSLVRRVWPRWLIRALPQYGFGMLVEAHKGLQPAAIVA